MSKKIQRTKRLKRAKKTKRTKRKKRTQINRRKKTLKGGMKRLFSGLGFGGSSWETDPDLEEVAKAEAAYAQRVAAEAEAAQRAAAEAEAAQRAVEEKKKREKKIIARIFNDWLDETFSHYNGVIPKTTILGELTRITKFSDFSPSLTDKFKPSEDGPLVTNGLLKPWGPLPGLTFGNSYGTEIVKIFKEEISRVLQEASEGEQLRAELEKEIRSIFNGYILQLKDKYKKIALDIDYSKMEWTDQHGTGIPSFIIEQLTELFRKKGVEFEKNHENLFFLRRIFEEEKNKIKESVSGGAAVQRSRMPPLMTIAE